jgi:toxin YoeB
VNLSFSSRAWADYTYRQTADPKMIARINDLLKDIIRNPFSGIGKPETLKHEFRGY